ncbi:MAG: phage tail protein [Myxococcota bacterium]|nr:phage tail protein [Myxococcota bacterium]
MMRLALTLGFALVVSAVASSASAQVTAARFSITIDGYELAVVSSVSSLGSYSEVIESTSSGPGGVLVVRRVPGKTRARDVVLKRAFSPDTTLNAWREAVELGDLAAAIKSVTLTGYNTTGEPVVRYHLENAWPSTLEVFTDQTTGLLMETVTLVCDRIQRVSP